MKEPSYEIDILLLNQVFLVIIMLNALLDHDHSMRKVNLDAPKMYCGVVVR
jgi:hypothetical protein